MAVDDSHVWAGTTGGLLRLNKATELALNPMLDDFENHVITKEIWNIPQKRKIPWGISADFSIDDNTGANGSSSSLRITYQMEPEPAQVKDDFYMCSWCYGTFTKDLASYEGFTFFVKVEGPEPTFSDMAFCLAGVVENQRSQTSLEGYCCRFTPVIGEWTRVVVPFTAFPMPGMHDIVNGILELYKVDAIGFEFASWSWHPGEELTFWIDEISFYKEGEFEPTVPDMGTAVHREE
jgi:hypothetical protein